MKNIKVDKIKAINQLTIPESNTKRNGIDLRWNTKRKGFDYRDPDEENIWLTHSFDNDYVNQDDLNKSHSEYHKQNVAPIYLYVGLDKEFKSIQEAWDSIKYKSINRRVYIKLDPGTYTSRGIDLSAIEGSRRIFIIGDTNSPEKYIINLVKTNDGNGYGLRIWDANVYLRGFTIKGSGLTSGNGLYLSDSNVKAYKLIIKDVSNGISSYNSYFSCSTLKMLNIYNNGVSTSNSFINIPSCVMTANSKNTSGYAVYCVYGKVICHYSELTNFRYGITCHHNSFIYSNSTKIIGGRGFICEDNSIMQASSCELTVDNQAVQANRLSFINSNETKVHKANQGFFAYNGSQISALSTLSNNKAITKTSAKNQIIHNNNSSVTSN
jgi:hypothetical protein